MFQNLHDLNGDLMGFISNTKKKSLFLPLYLFMLKIIGWKTIELVVIVNASAIKCKRDIENIDVVIVVSKSIKDKRQRHEGFM